jgi:hypothetical protein
MQAWINQDHAKKVGWNFCVYMNRRENALGLPASHSRGKALSAILYIGG